MTEPQPEPIEEPVQEPQEEPETFDRAYVEKLRSEAAESRVKAKRATALEEALRDAVVDRVAHEILQDTSALVWSDEFAGEDGLPDPEKIRGAAEALADSKPHLARVRGDVLQGHRGEESDAGSVDLAGLLRGGA